jgi:hypothetical protein
MDGEEGGIPSFFKRLRRARDEMAGRSEEVEEGAKEAIMARRGGGRSRTSRLRKWKFWVKAALGRVLKRAK